MRSHIKKAQTKPCARIGAHGVCVVSHGYVSDTSQGTAASNRTLLLVNLCRMKTDSGDAASISQSTTFGLQSID